MDENERLQAALPRPFRRALSRQDREEGRLTVGELARRVLPNVLDDEIEFGRTSAEALDTVQGFPRFRAGRNPDWQGTASRIPKGKLAFCCCSCRAGKVAAPDGADP